MHQPKVEFNKNILQPKLDVQQRIKNSEREREREREYSLICVGKIQREWKREKQIFIVKKMERRRVKIKRNMKGWKNCKVKVQSSGEIKKLKVRKMLEEE